jgi:hypothetical protein
MTLGTPIKDWRGVSLKAGGENVPVVCAAGNTLSAIRLGQNREMQVSQATPREVVMSNRRHPAWENGRQLKTKNIAFTSISFWR